MAAVLMMHLALGAAASEAGKTALPLTDPDLNMSLGHRFRQRLRENPMHFLESLGVMDFPRLWVQWVALCPTAGLILLRGGAPDPEVWCLLLNGVEDEAEVASIRAHCPMFEAEWDRLAPERPLAVAGYRSPGWRTNPAVVTVLGAFANAFFTQFGESG